MSEQYWRERCLLVMAERDEARTVLKQAHHELTTISGLWAADNEQFTEPFRLHPAALLKRIDEVIGDG